MPRVIVEYKMWLREKIGKDIEEIGLSAGSTIRDLVSELARRHEVLRRLVGEDRGDRGLVILVNGVTVPENYTFKEGDRVIVLPLVSGG